MLTRRAFVAGVAAAPLGAMAQAARGDVAGSHAAVFATRDAARSWLAAGGQGLRAGDTFAAADVVYRWQPGAAWIPDMPDVVPHDLPSPDHFGYAPDLRWRLLAEGDLDGANAGVYGPYREGGTNALKGFLLADTYARKAGMGLCRASGDYAVKSFLRRRADGLRARWPFDFFAERPEDIRVSIYRSDVFHAVRDDPALSSADIAELVHQEMPDSAYQVVLNPGGLGGTVIFRPRAGQYIDICRPFQIKAKWSHQGHLWTHFQTFQMGLNLAATGASWDGDRIIGQYSYFGSKPANRGNLGVVAGASTGYYLPEAHRKRSDIHLRALVCRAASVIRDDNDPYVDSDPSILTGVFGWVARPVFRVGTFGRTNTASNMLFLAHWGGRYVPPGRPERLDKSAYALIETWHPEDVRLDVLSLLDRHAHGFHKGWELAAVAGARIGPVRQVGVSHPYWIGVGDVSDAFATAAQRGRVNRSLIRVGHQTATGIAPDPGSDYYGVLYKGTGTSKFETYRGTTIPLQRHGTLNVVCDGHRIEAVPGTLETIRMRQFRGQVDLGTCRLRGAAKALYVLGGDGRWRARLEEARGVIHIQNNAHGRLSGPSVSGHQDRMTGPPPRQDAQDAEVGAGDRIRAGTIIHTESQVFATVTRREAHIGETVLPIKALGNAWHDINAGDRLEIALPDGTTCSVWATGLVVDGAMFVRVTALPCRVAEGATVRVTQPAAVVIDATARSVAPVRIYASRRQG